MCTHCGDSRSRLTCCSWSSGNDVHFARLSVVSRGKRGSLPAGRTRAGDARGSVRELLKERWMVPGSVRCVPLQAGWYRMR